MTVIEAMQNARALLESLGYTSGDIYDDLNMAIQLVAEFRPATGKMNVRPKLPAAAQ